MRLHQGHSELRTENKKLHSSVRSSTGNWIVTGSSAVTLKPFYSKPQRSRRWREIESLSSAQLCSAGSARSLTATISLGKILLFCSFHHPWIRLDGHGFHIAPRLTKPLFKCSQLEACPAIASRPRPLFRCP